jgi:radical SAM superfamily enzyme YgiQ (UPF0313 family)
MEDKEGVQMKRTEMLLINPPSKIIKKSGPFKMSKSTGSVSPPLGIAYIAAVVEREGIGVRIIDCEAEDIGIDDLEARIRRYKPKLVGVTGTTPSFNYCVQTAKAVKGIDESITVVLGGSHASALPKQIMGKHDCFDYVVAGEGEFAFLEIARHVLDGKRLGSTTGIYTRKNGRVKGTGLAPIIENLDDLPFPARHLLPVGNYRPPADLAICIGGKAPLTPYTTIITTRGCPFNCVFCSQPVFGRRFRARSAKNVVDELEHVHSKYGVKFVNIYDDTFTIIKKRVIDICKEIRKRRLDIAFYCRSRIDTIDDETLKYLKSAGCEIISYGVEAGSDRVLKRIRKNITVQQTKRIFRETHKRGIVTKGYFMIGNTGERESDIYRTVRLAKELDPLFAFFSIASILPASELYDIAVEKCLIDPSYEWTKSPPIYEENLDAEQLKKFQTYAYRSFYIRPRQIFKLLSKIKSYKQLGHLAGGIKLLLEG